MTAGNSHESSEIGKNSEDSTYSVVIAIELEICSELSDDRAGSILTEGHKESVAEFEVLIDFVTADDDSMKTLTVAEISKNQHIQ